ncbi:hypothetical protein GCM10011404_16070 [Sphingomonas prati]|nr:hypothetical protein GCM10011404_16070 [Sphingomonas prati]
MKIEIRTEQRGGDDALAEADQFGRQQDERSDDQRGEHDHQQRGQDAAEAPFVEACDGEAARVGIGEQRTAD